MMLTPQQRDAVTSRGNVLVNAGAGTGKTRTLVERCVRHLLDPADPVSLDQILVVTFTEAAAAEIRQRIRGRIEAESAAQPTSGRLREQLALLDAAPISTLHGFCLRLVREHACELGLDPLVGVLDEQQSAVLAAETLDRLFEDHYAGRAEGWESVRKMVLEQARGWDKPVRDLVLRIHEFTQTRPDPEGWLANERARFEQATPMDWLRWLLEVLAPWRDDWLQVLRGLEHENPNAAAMARILEALPDAPDRATAAGAVQRLLETDAVWPNRRKTVLREPLQGIYEEAGFLITLLRLEGDGGDPLEQDWNWSRDPMAALLGLAQEFGRRFQAEKHDSGFVDFHDLEQLALKLLWDEAAGRATPLAERWRRRLRFVFVDEYQDINAAQDRILTALSRAGAEANRFVVGDVKQSIYRFRQAAPWIFQAYAAGWSGGHQGTTLQLTENFRSREVILDFVNAFFGPLMHREMGGVHYGEEARLQFGAREARSGLAAGSEQDPAGRVELLVRVREGTTADSGPAGGGDYLTELSEAGKEAHLAGQRMQAMIEAGTRVWDESMGAERAVGWRDMVILLRSPRMKVEAYAKEFARLGIPLEARRSAFFDSIEVQDLLQLLTLLDNPLQDIPLLAVLRSPLVGLSIEELGRIRLTFRPAGFWAALRRFAAASREDPVWPRVHEFLDRFRKWRSLARQASLSQRLELILRETCYLEWQAAQPRGEQRQANIRQLVALARHFDDIHRQGLHRFLRFIEAQRDAAGDREPASMETGDAVRLMSIHQSKGLEFPIVVLGDLGKGFNLTDGRGGVLLDEQYGLCPEIRPPGGLEAYPSLPYWLASRRQRREALGEELRLLYVAMTRARDRLILLGSCSPRSLEERWKDSGRSKLDPATLARATSVLDWIMPWLGQQSGNIDWKSQPAGRTKFCTWTMIRELVPVEPSGPEQRASAVATVPLEQLEAVKNRLGWTYPASTATARAAKTSVTTLRRGLAGETEGEAEPAAWVMAPDISGRDGGDAEGDRGRERGIAYHRVFERLDLGETASRDGLARELVRLRAGRILTPEQFAAVDLAALERFWRSELGGMLRARRAEVRRELPFTLRLTPADLPEGPFRPPEGEFVVMQGVVDLAVIGPDEIWVADFKTDRVRPGGLEERVARYSPQIQLYGHALGRIYGRPVTHHWLCFLEAGVNCAVPGLPHPRAGG